MFYWMKIKSYLYVIRPQFSIAPAEKSGMAMLSSFEMAYVTLVYFSRLYILFSPNSRAKSIYFSVSGFPNTLNIFGNSWDGRSRLDLYTKSDITKAIKYEDIRTVGSNACKLRPSSVGGLKIFQNGLKKRSESSFYIFTKRWLYDSIFVKNR